MCISFCHIPYRYIKSVWCLRRWIRHIYLWNLPNKCDMTRTSLMFGYVLCTWLFMFIFRSFTLLSVSFVAIFRCSAEEILQCALPSLRSIDQKRERKKESNGIQVMKHDFMECLPYFNNCEQYYCIKWYQKCGEHSQHCWLNKSMGKVWRMCNVQWSFDEIL